MRFEWDPSKAARNLAKHGVSFEEAATVFRDGLPAPGSDPDDTIRIISARPVTQSEGNIYEEG